ncbi:hypothetical protein B0H12DRAFT_1233262 [Mycena haematopus]|nr:hypothetical protein B0H12DRAFT_1233262 [Mycena haematopus]
MEMPGLKTRTQNKDTHPAKKVGLEKKTRRTEDQMKDARKAEAQSKAKEMRQEKEKLQALAAFEDKQRDDDIAHAKTANHPADRPMKPPASGEEDLVKSHAPIDEDVDMAEDRRPVKHHAPIDKDVDMDNGEDSDAFAAPEDESSQESDEGQESDAPPKKKKQKTKGPSRADILASRTTQDSTGTPESNAEVVKAKKRKSKDKQKEGRSKKPKNEKKKSGLDKKVVENSKALSAADPDDDSMVAPGGPAIDNDSDEELERPKKGKKKRGVPAAPPLAIKAIASKEPTRKALRDGAAKWGLKHLPHGTSDEFTSEVVPLVRDLAGTLPPWTNPNIEQLQRIVDQVFPDSKYTVTKTSPWYGLIGYRLNDWRNKFATQALQALELLIEGSNTKANAGDEIEEDLSDSDNQDGPDDATLPAENELEPNADEAVLTADNADKADPEPAPRKFTFDTPEGIAEFVEWALQSHKNGTKAYQWKTWGNGVDKKGFLQSHLICYTFACHLSCIAAVPGGYKASKAPPVGALLLSMQAVERALQLWKTGEYINPHNTSSHFSVENWGDYAGAADKKSGARPLVLRATRYLKSVTNWGKERWEEVTTASAKFVVAAGGRKGGASSRSGSDASDGELVPEEDIIIVSD